MPGISPCLPCGTFPQVTNIPGIEGVAGVNGTNGVDGFTLTTVDFIVPAASPWSITIAVASTAWMVVGMIVVIGQGQGAVLANPGPATFQVTAIPSTTTVTLTWLQYPGDVAGGSTISAGAVVAAGFTTPGGGLSVYASGTAYTLTAAAALLDFGTTDPALVISAPGTWLIKARVRYDFAAWKSTSMNIVSRLFESVNTSAPLANSTTTMALPDTSAIGPGVTYTAGIIDLPPVIYTTTRNNDSIQIQGNLSALASTSGDVKAVEAEIVAIRLA